MVSNPNQQSAMMKTDAGTCASLSVSLLTTSIPEAEWNSLPEACVNADTITAFQTHAAPLRALSGVHTPPHRRDTRKRSDAYRTRTRTRTRISAV